MTARRSFRLKGDYWSLFDLPRLISSACHFGLARGDVFSRTFVDTPLQHRPEAERLRLRSFWLTTYKTWGLSNFVEIFCNPCASKNNPNIASRFSRCYWDGINDSRVYTLLLGVGKNCWHFSGFFIILFTPFSLIFRVLCASPVTLPSWRSPTPRLFSVISPLLQFY